MYFKVKYFSKCFIPTKAVAFYGINHFDKYFTTDNDKSKLVEMLRPIKNSLRGSYNEKSPQSTKAKRVVPADFLPSARVKV